MTTLLAGDIGGTKTILSLYSDHQGRLEKRAERRFASADWDDLAPMVRQFLADPHGGETSPGGAAPEPPAAACFAVAGPVQAGRARLTNLPWRLDEAALASACAIPRVELVNDFAVLIYGLPHLATKQQAPIRAGTADPAAPVLILGAGTGLGVAIGIPTAGGLQAVASEAAHGDFAPRSEAEWRLRQWLIQHLGIQRVSIERVVSGTGLGHVARWLLAERHPSGDHPLAACAADAMPAAVAAAASAAAPHTDPLARDALDLWLGAYGAVCGDLALACLSRGGVWLAGGTAAKLLDELRSESFSRAFLTKGRLQPPLDAMPITALTDPAVGSFSAACRARMLMG